MENPFGKVTPLRVLVKQLENAQMNVLHHKSLEEEHVAQAAAERTRIAMYNQRISRIKGDIAVLNAQAEAQAQKVHD